MKRFIAGLAIGTAVSLFTASSFAQQRTALMATHTAALGFLSLVEALDLGVVANREVAASTYAQAKYLLPFLVLPLPFFLPLVIFLLPTYRQ